MYRTVPRSSTAAVATTVLAVIALLSPVGTGIASASGSVHPTTSAANASGWAYVGHRDINVSGTARNGTYSLSASFGFAVVVNRTTLPGGGMELDATRAMGAAYDLAYCAPTCTHPTLTASVRFRATEEVSGHANLTAAAQVVANGSAVPGIGVSNGSSTLAIRLSENDSVSLIGPILTRTAAAGRTVSVDGALAIAFAPSLGLFPLHPTPGERWTSSAGFLASGTWTVASSFARIPLTGPPTSGHFAVTSNASHSGNVSISGSDLGDLTLADGRVAAVLALDMTGPLRMREGLLLLPSAADPFSGAPALASDANGTLGESTSEVDLAGSDPGPGMVVASTASFTAAGQNPGDRTPGGMSPAIRFTPSIESSGPVAVQAQPASSSTGTETSRCLLAGTCLGAPGTSPGGAAGYLRPLLGLGIAGAALAAIVGAVVVTRRPKAPPRRNADLYPVVALTDREPAEPRPRSDPPADDEPDPLGHLW